MLPRAAMAAMQHSTRQTAPYISNVVDEEVETLAPLVNALPVPQRPSMGSQALTAGPAQLGESSVHSGRFGMC